MRYRRVLLPGGCFFFTLVTEGRRKILVEDSAVDLLRESFRAVAAKRPFTIDAIVIMPDHLHCVWTMPSDDMDYATRWRLIKTRFTKNCDATLKPAPDQIRQKRKEQAIWQHRYWEHTIRNEVDFEHHVDYVHYNPVKHGYVSRPCNWQHSSFHRYVKRGVISRDWGAAAVVLPQDVGSE